MKQRCNYPGHTSYPLYGGRGIRVCDRWTKFENFWEDMGECPPEFTLERIDSDKNYEPGNCVWADRQTQNENRNKNPRCSVCERHGHNSRNHHLFVGRETTEEFWAFVVERENIRLRRLHGWPREQWTNDPIFKTYSFTNIHRSHDRTTVMLRREMYDLHPGEHPSPVHLINAATFRYTGTIGAARQLGWCDEWTTEWRGHFEQTIRRMIALNEKPFTGSYIVPNAGSTAPKHDVVSEILNGIWTHREWILDVTTWQEATARMSELFGVGSFMAKEVLLDYILATGWVPDDWTTWTPVGPGARKGAGVVRYGSLLKLKEEEALEVCRELYSLHEEYWPDNYEPLALTDVQFTLCEWAKYFKVLAGEGSPKRRFSPTQDDVTVRINTLDHEPND